MEKQLPPSNRGAEESTLGACYIDPQALPLVSGILEGPDDFWYPEHKSLYKAMLRLQEAGTPIDATTLDGDGDPVLLSRLVDTVPTSIHAEHYARIVERLARRRRLIDAAARITVLAYDESTDLGGTQDEAVQLVLGARGRERRDARPLSELAAEYYDRIETLAKDDKPLGLPTGYKDLDKILGGLHKSDLIILAARPSTGKTALAGGIALNTAKLGAAVGFFSLEMADQQVVQRLVAAESGVDSERLKTGKLAESDWPKFIPAIDALGKLPIWIDDMPRLSMTELRAKATRLDAEVGLDLVVVDYLQLMRAQGKDRYEKVTAISGDLKALARDLNVPVLALSQLSRACEQRGDKRPRLSDLRESGALEQDADVVVFLYRDEMYDENTKRPNIADVIVAKHRNGKTGTADLFFRRELAQFLDAEVRRQAIEDDHYNHYANRL